MKNHFDHTFLVNSDDPLLPQWKKLHEKEALDLRIMENVGMEYTANLVWQWANLLLVNRDKGRTCCIRADAIENSFNSACFDAIPDWFNV